MTGGEQDLVAWKPTQAPRQHSVQYRPRKALLRSVPFAILPQIARPPSWNSAFLRMPNQIVSPCLLGANAHTGLIQMMVLGCRLHHNLACFVVTGQDHLLRTALPLT